MKRALYKVFAYGRWGLADRDGNQVFPIKYRHLEEWVDHIWCIQKEEGTYSWIDDESGNEVPEPKSEPRDDGFPPDWKTVVRKYAKSGIKVPSEKDYAGESRFEFPYFFDGYITVYDKKTKKEGYMNREGIITITPAWDIAFPFSGEYATVGNWNGKWTERYKYKVKHIKYGLIDRTGNVVIPTAYDEIRSYSENIAVMIGDKWGFVDFNNHIIIPPVYDGVGGFSENRVAVMVGDKWGFIDFNNHIIIPPVYDAVGGFHDGLSWVEKDDKWGYIDADGNEVLPVEQGFGFNKLFSCATPFLEVIRYYEENGEWAWRNNADVPVVVLERKDVEVHFEHWKPVVTTIKTK